MTKRLSEKGTTIEFWVEFGPEGAFLYTGKGVVGFDVKSPVLTLTPQDLKIQSYNNLYRMATQALGWSPAREAEAGAALSSAIKTMIQGVSAPNKYIGKTKVFHIDPRDSASIDYKIDANTGKFVTSDDAKSLTYRSRTEKLQRQAEVITKRLRSFLELSGFDPNGGTGVDTSASTTSGLPIQQKNSDILGSIEISDDADDTQNAEDTISADTSNQAVIVFERFDPLTRKNLQGLSEFEDAVKREGGDGFIFISQLPTEDPEVMSYEETVKFLKLVIEERNLKATLVDDSNIENITDVANYLASEGYKSLIICTTSDKLGEYQNELIRKNNVSTGSGTFSFEPLETRKIDALDNSEMKEINNAALDGDFSTFLKYIGTGDIKLAKKLFTRMRQRAI
jgi:hypothetical protein